MQDYFIEVGTGKEAHLKRTLTLTSSKKADGLYLRIGRGKDIKKLGCGQQPLLIKPVAVVLNQ